MKEQIKSRILMEMSGVIGEGELRELKMSLERNLYGVEIKEICTEVAVKSRCTNDELLKKFVFEKRMEGLSLKTLEQYTRETRRFFDTIEKDCVLYTHEDVLYYLAFLTGRISPNSVDNARKFLKPFFKWLYENEYIKRDIFIKVKPIKRVEKQKEYLNGEEIASIRDACKNDIKGLAIIDFLLSTGVRVSEFTSVKIKDIDFQNGSVSIYSNKTRAYRKVYLEPAAVKHLRDYVSTRNDFCPYLFVNTRRNKYGTVERMNTDSVQKTIKKYCGKAEINKKCSVHLFRKTLATRLYSKGMDAPSISKILGHKNFNTTEKFYLSVCDNDIHYLYHKYI